MFGTAFKDSDDDDDDNNGLPFGMGRPAVQSKK